MPNGFDFAPTTLEASSPYELRLNLGTNVSDADVRHALATGDLGFLHSFTTGSTLDGPGVRVVAWTTGCMWRCLYCHNPDTWTMSNGIPVTVEQAVEQLRKYRQGKTPIARHDLEMTLKMPENARNFPHLPGHNQRARNAPASRKGFPHGP